MPIRLFNLLFHCVLTCGIAQIAKSQNSFIRKYANQNIPLTIGYDCAEANDGNIFVATTGMNQVLLEENLYILKLDNAGDTIWMKFYDFSLTNVIPRFLMSTPDLGFIVTGEGFIMKADSGGNVIWLRDLNSHYGHWIAPIPEGYLACISELPGLSDNNYIIRIDFAGNLISSHWLNIGNQNWLYQAVRLSNGNYMLAAAIYNHTSPSTHYIMADSALSMIGTFDTEGQSIRAIESSDHHLLVTYEGIQSTDIIKADTLGNILWHHAMYPRHQPTCITETYNREIIISGVSWLGTGPLTEYIFKFDSTGYLLNVDSICCSNSIVMAKATSDGGYITMMNDSTSYATVIKNLPLNSSACIAGSTGMIDTSNHHPFYFPFSTNWIVPVSFQLQIDTAIVYNGGVVIPECSKSDVFEMQNHQFEFSVYPNPSYEKIYLLPGSTEDILNISIFGQLGELVYENNTLKANREISLDVNLIPGKYYITLSVANGFAVQKIVVIK